MNYEKKEETLAIKFLGNWVDTSR